MAGQYQLEQTFLVPVAAMLDEQRSPLRILERLDRPPARVKRRDALLTLFTSRQRPAPAVIRIHFDFGGLGMRHRLLALVMLSMMPAFVAGQGAPHSAKLPKSAYTAPRTPWGDPDLQGVWPGTAMMGVPQERPAAVRRSRGRRPTKNSPRDWRRRNGRPMRPTRNSSPPRAGGGPPGNTGGPGHWGERGLPQRQTSLIVDPADGRMPAMTPEGQRRTAAIPASRYYDNNGGGVFNGPEDLSVYDDHAYASMVPR